MRLERVDALEGRVYPDMHHLIPLIRHKEFPLLTTPRDVCAYIRIRVLETGLQMMLTHKNSYYGKIVGLFQKSPYLRCEYGTPLSWPTKDGETNG